MKDEKLMHPIKLNSNTHGFQLFLDLDGVFADFDGMFKHLSGMWPHEFLNCNKKSQFWAIVNSKIDFFYSLDLMKDADVLWNHVKQYDPVFLTGAPAGDRAKDDKRQWVKEKFGDEYTTIVLPKKEKQLYSGFNKILIDDTPTNIEQWVEKGGYGILHMGNVHETINNLEETISYCK